MTYQKKIKTRKLVSITTMVGTDQLEVLKQAADDNNTDRAKLIRDSIDSTYDIKLLDNGK